MRLPQLTACPVCHGTLNERLPVCPQCQSELQPYYEQHEAAGKLLLQAINEVSRGELGPAAKLVGEAERLLPQPAEAAQVLRAVIALREHRLDDAWRLAEALPEGCPEKPGLLEDIATAAERVESAKMHYNLALTSARQGALADAAHHSGKAIDLAPHLPEMWRLAAKIALKRGELEEAERYVLRGAERFPADGFLAPLAEALKQAG